MARPRKDFEVLVTNLDRALAARLNFLCMCPLKKKPKYGMRRTIVNLALKRYLDELEAVEPEALQKILDYVKNDEKADIVLNHIENLEAT